MRPLRWIVPAALALFTPARARAEGAPASEAQSQYDRATVIMEQRRYDPACKMFDEAAKLLPESIGVRSLAAECYVRWEKLSTALLRYEAIEAESLAAGQRARAAEARGRVEALRARVARMRVLVPPEVRALPGIQIRWGSAPLDPSQWDEPFTVDQGKYSLEVVAPGRRPLATTVDIERDGYAYSISVGVPATLVQPSDPPLLPRRPIPKQQDGSSIPGVAVLSVGVAGLGLGVMTGAMTLATESAVRSTCKNGLCPPSQQPREQRAGTWASVAEVSFVVGSALAAAGVALIVLKPFGRSAPPVRVSAGPGSVWAVGRF